MDNKLIENIEAYRNDDAVEKYSVYNLYPNERYLIEKYFDKHKFVLDLACGTGRTTLRLKELGYQTKGVDFSNRLIEVAQMRFPYIPFEVGDFCNIQEANSSIDNILLSYNGLDYAFPEDQRVKALSECARVLRKGGYFIMSAHNIKSLHFSPYYLKNRKAWMARNLLKAFKEKDYIYDLKMWTFYCSPKYCISQIESTGFRFLEIKGFRKSSNMYFNTYFSPYNYFVFIRQ